MAGVISRLTMIELNLTTGGDGLAVVFFSWLAVSEHVATENQNHPLALPIRLTAISLQALPDLRRPAAVTVASSGCPGSRVAVSTTLKSDNVVTASCRRCGWLAPVALAAASVVIRPAAVTRAATAAARRIEANIMVIPPDQATVHGYLLAILASAAPLLARECDIANVR